MIGTEAVCAASARTVPAAAVRRVRRFTLVLYQPDESIAAERRETGIRNGDFAWSSLPGCNDRFRAGMSSSPPERHAGPKRFLRRCSKRQVFHPRVRPGKRYRHSPHGRRKRRRSRLVARRQEDHTRRINRLKAKIEEYIANGAELGWLIDTEERTVWIYRPGCPRSASSTRSASTARAGRGLCSGASRDLGVSLLPPGFPVQHYVERR